MVWMDVSTGDRKRWQSQQWKLVCRTCLLQQQLRYSRSVPDELQTEPVDQLNSDNFWLMESLNPRIDQLINNGASYC